MPFPILAAVIAGGAMLGSAALNKSAANKATSAANNAADRNDATNRYMYDQTRGDLADFRAAGAPAVNALMQRAGIAPAAAAGQPGQGASAAAPQAQAGPDYAGYFAANPDLAADPKLMRHNPGDLTGDGQVDNADRGAWHYQNYGQNEGRALPQPVAQSTPVAEAPKPAGGNAGPSPVEQAPVAPNLMNAPRPDAAPAPMFERPTDLAVPAYQRQADMSAPDSASYFANFEASPDYQFRRSQGLDAANSGFAARGMLKSGAAAKGITDYASNLASGEFNNWFARQMQRYQADNSAYQYGQNRNDNVFSQDRSYGTNLWQTQQGRQDQNFENDRTSGTQAYQYGQNRQDNIFSEDRGYQAGRYDQETSNLFGLAGIGANAAAGTASAGNVFAQNSTANNNQRATNTANAAIAGAGSMSNLIGQGLQAYGMYQAGQPVKPAAPGKTGTF